MKIKWTFHTLIALMLFTACQQQENTQPFNYAVLVNPFIGTGGHGHTYPGASAPFGFVQLSPDSRLDGWDGCGGYHYSDSVIYGFSHTHLSGTGVSDYGDVLLMPAHEIEFHNGYGQHPDSGYGSRFSHERENAEAGYYQVFLEDTEIDVELTSTQRAGFHKYTFNKKDRPLLLIDLKHRDSVLSHHLRFINDSTISGHRVSRAWAAEQHLYFHLKLSEPFVDKHFNQDSSKVYLEFNDLSSLLLKIGLSAVDTLGARQNLEKEIPHWSFNQTKQNTQDLWNQELNRIQVQSLSDSDQVIFYTALYHSFLNPNVFMDVDGRFRGTDLKIHNGDHQNYTIFSLWDTYRATHPLFTITQRERTLDFIQTFLKQYQYGGKLPVWELVGNYTGCMIGYHVVSVIADAYVKGIQDFDTDLALEAMISIAEAEELGKADYIKDGYLAKDVEHESVSKTLEYAYNDWCIAQFAKAIGRDSIYQVFIQRAQNYQNLFDPNTGFMRSKRNQQFNEPFNPKEVNFDFTEANSWQYSFYVPHDIKGLIDLHGSADQFEAKLDQLFAESQQTSGRHQVDITGLVGQYAHGNEPSHHMAYLYNYIGKPNKTQAMSRKLIREMYTSLPDGLIGNEDCGQMSSWYVLSALGFYPVNPGSDEYVLTSPSIQEGKIVLENGNIFLIKTLNNSIENIYIEKVILNGKEHKRSFIHHNELMKGGELIFEMGSSPNTNFFEEHVSTAIEDEGKSAVPFVETEKQIFSDSLKIELNHVDPQAQIYYQLNEEAFEVYEQPIIIDDHASLKIKAKSADKRESQALLSKFYKVNLNRSVSYSMPYNPQYSAGGDKGLVDQLRGGSDFRSGYWQGFQGEDVVITVQLDGVEEFSVLKASFIQDINSWIWMPKSIRFSYSMDGKNYTIFEKLEHDIPTKEYGVFNLTLEQSTSKKKARFIRLEAEQYGTIPNWHLGKGGESFIFIDEIEIL